VGPLLSCLKEDACLEGLERLGVAQEVDSKRGGAKTRGIQVIFQPLPKPSPPAVACRSI